MCLSTLHPESQMESCSPIDQVGPAISWVYHRMRIHFYLWFHNAFHGYHQQPQHRCIPHLKPFHFSVALNHHLNIYTFIIIIVILKIKYFIIAAKKREPGLRKLPPLRFPPKLDRSLSKRPKLGLVLPKFR